MLDRVFSFASCFIRLIVFCCDVSFPLSSLGDTLSDPEVDAYNVRVGTQSFSPGYKFTTDTKLVETSDAIRTMGSDIVKFYMGKNYSGQYGITLSSSITNLTAMAKNEASCRHVLDTSFRHFLIWVYTFASNGNDSWWKDGYSASERQNEYNEIYNFSQYVLTNYNNSGKSFYFGHWEGDWYLISPNNTGVNPSPTAIQGMIDWLNNRQKAVDDAIRDTPHTNVFIYNYTEANRVLDAMWNAPTNNQRLVNTVLPYVTNIDYVSWSSYDGMNLGQSDLFATLNYVESNLPTNKAAVIPGKRVIIGEYGWGGSLSSAAQEAPTRTYIQRLISWGAPIILFWQMYDNEGLQYWLIDSANNKTASYYLHQWFFNHARLSVAQFRETNGRVPTDAEFATLVTPVLNQSLNAPTNLSVANLPVSQLTASNAVINGRIAQGIYGSEQANVWVYWGKQDGGTNRNNWEQATNLGINRTFNPATFSAGLTNLLPRTNYFYRYYASNSLGEAWAPFTTQFTTAVLNTNDFGARMKISLSGYTQSESLTNFPVLISFNTNKTGFSYQKFASRTGGDLRFTDATGTQLIPHEVDEWNTNGSSQVWVRLPVLAGSDDFIWAYWGNPLSTNAPAYSTNGSVWSQNFELVWHLKEFALPFPDATLKHPATTGTAPASTTAGLIGRASLFNGSSHFLSAGTVNLGDKVTLSAWVKVDPTANTIQTIWANKSGGSSTPGFALFANSYQSSDQKLILETGHGGAAAYAATDTNVVTLNQWRHVAAVIDRIAGKAKLFVDGKERTLTEDVRIGFQNQAVTMLGRFTNSPISSAYPFKGLMDEVRIETDTRSSNWIWATWMNVASNSTFLTYSSVMQQTPSITAALINSNITVRWPSHGTTFNLYTTTNLSPPTVWSPVTNQATLVSNEWSLTLPLAVGTNRFYQLRSP